MLLSKNSKDDTTFEEKLFSQTEFSDIKAILYA